jgi:curli biogenesis system outer membrane secretion channel CsgG
MMFAVLVLLSLSLPMAQSPKPTTPQAVQSATASPETKIDPEIAVKLLKVRRIYVDSFGDDAISKPLQAMVINAFAESKRFIITENKDKADAILKGTGLEKTSQEFHAIGEATSVAAAAGGHHGDVSGSVADGTGSISGSSSGGFAAKKLGTSDSQASTETINDARLAVRLVASDGDVVWTTTKESRGAKYKGASADVADQIVKQLLRDLDKLQTDGK